MSHKAGHIIIQSLVTLPTVTHEQRCQLEDIEARNEYTMADRLYIGYIAATVADDDVD